MAWTVDFDPRALKELEKLGKPAQKRILRLLQERLLKRTDPRELGKALTGDKVGLWRYRVGDFRLICHIKDTANQVLVLRVSQSQRHLPLNTGSP